MIYKFIDNELYIANKIKLSDEEKTILIYFLTLTEINIEDISELLNIEEYKIINIIQQLNYKLNYFFKIVKDKRNNCYIIKFNEKGD